jgi:putative membrane protein
MLDLFLAGLHHLAVFALIAVFAAEFVLLRPGLEGCYLGRLSAIDGAYGAAAGIVIVVGILRVIFGAAGWEYYVFNWAFWAKMAAFAAMGAISVIPTMTFIKWRRAYLADPGFTPPAIEIERIRRLLYVEAGLVALVPIFAAAMARGYGVL